MKPILWPLPFLIVYPTLAFAEGGGNSFTIDQVMSGPFASSLVAAPAGAKVAWLINERGQRNVWVASAPDWKGRQLTNFDRDDGQEVAELAWAPDGTYLLFARGGDFENDGENPNPDLSVTKSEQAIWRVGMDGAPAKKLTEGHAPAISPKGDIVAFLRGGQIFTMTTSGESVKNAAVQKGSVTGLRWSPDGSMLAFVSERRDHSFIGVYTPADKSLRYLDPSVDKDSEPVWSPDSNRIAYLRIPSTGRAFGFEAHREGEPWSIRATSIKTGNARQVFRAKNGPGSLFHAIQAEQQIFWTNDDHLVFPWEQTGWCHLYTLSVSGGTPVELTPGEGEVEHAAVSHDAQTIYFSTNFKDIDRRHLWAVNAAGGQPPTQVTGGETIEWEPAPAADGLAMAFLASSYNESAHAMVRESHGELQAPVPQATPPDFPAKSLVHPQPVMITASDGLVIHGQLFLPPNESDGQRHPALIFFHGGSRRQMLLGFHYMYYYSNAYALNQYFAHQGYVVLSVNYRSGIGYGLDFREAINYGARGSSEFNDVMGAGLYLKARPDVDPKRIGVWGGSYGGYLTALALSRASDLFAAGVDLHGVHDWSTLRDYFGATLGGNPAEQNEQREAERIAFDSSPIASVNTWRSPVLLIHGDDDRNVSFSQTVVLADALRQRHVEFEELIFPNEIHDFLMQQHWVRAYKAAADFFARKLRGNTEAVQVQ
jgi:dipeptidyl aminopeptidase/acylaminoacyl peptidase